MLKSYHPEFLTATILNWQHLLSADFKKIIVNTLSWLVKQRRCKIYGFVIMPNHIHLLWKIEDGFDRANVQGALLSFTAHEFKKCLRGNEMLLENYQVNLIDRSFQFWQRDCVVKECWGEEFLKQKLDYIHNNPLQVHWNLSDFPENYYWSSASFYESGESPFEFITYYKE
ncbi:Transposase IS200 like protein [compost metagenome]